MKLEDQVTPLQESIRLKELGVKQDSIFCYIGDETLPHQLYYTEQAHFECGASWYENRVAAFTVAELGQMLPPEFMTWFDGDVWHCSDGYENPYYMVGITEAQAKAAELISRLEATWISVDDVNARL